MTAEEAWRSVCFRGDSCPVAEGEHDVRSLVAEAVARLPDEVAGWLLRPQTEHVFICGSGQAGQYIPLYLFPMPGCNVEHRQPSVRVIFLSEHLRSIPRDVALWVIAHQIAHSWSSRPERQWHHDEGEADRLAESWGFPAPTGRAAHLAWCHQPQTGLAERARAALRYMTEEERARVAAWLQAGMPEDVVTWG